MSTINSDNSIKLSSQLFSNMNCQSYLNTLMVGEQAHKFCQRGSGLGRRMPTVLWWKESKLRGRGSGTEWIQGDGILRLLEGDGESIIHHRFLLSGMEARFMASKIRWVYRARQNSGNSQLVLYRERNWDAAPEMERSEAEPWQSRGRPSTQLLPPIPLFLLMFTVHFNS